jgi:hypothetical protein
MARTWPTLIVSTCMSWFDAVVSACLTAIVTKNRVT